MLPAWTLLERSSPTFLRYVQRQGTLGLTTVCTAGGLLDVHGRHRLTEQRPSTQMVYTDMQLPLVYADHKSGHK